MQNIDMQNYANLQTRWANFQVGISRPGPVVERVPLVGRA